MPIKRPQLINGEIYHIVIRGVADSKIFKDDSDHYRAIFSLYEFNTSAPITIRARRSIRNKAKKTKINREQFSVDSEKRDLLVKTLAFCFMPNHIHLLLRQIKPVGISQFMRKFGAGYASYFNKKYNRKGHLFQGRFRAVHVKDNEQLKTVFVYIHTNPISLIEPKWKERGIEDLQNSMNFLDNYKWSSFPDYLGKKNFPSVTQRDFILRVMDGKDGCREFVDGWIRYKRELKNFKEMALE